MNSFPLVLTSHIALLRGRCNLRFDEITYIEGNGNYTLFKCINGQEIMTSKSMSFYEQRLPPFLMRVHKSYYVNLQFISVFDGHFIKVGHQKRIEVARRRRKKLKDLLQAWLLNPNSLLQ